MPNVKRTRSVRMEVDGLVGIGELEEAALAFARSAPAQLVADAIESMIDELVDVVVGPFGSPWCSERQAEAPWACTGCASRRGFRRRGFRPKPRKVTTAAGTVAFRSQQPGRARCGRRPGRPPPARRSRRGRRPRSSRCVYVPPSARGSLLVLKARSEPCAYQAGTTRVSCDRLATNSLTIVLNIQRPPADVGQPALSPGTSSRRESRSA